MTSTTTFHLVRQGSAAKLGANSTGTISYAVLIDTDHTEPVIALTGNDGGGYFSREVVPILALRRCAEQAGTDAPMGASAFKPAFVGRSTNNGYFAVAALCAEGLLNRVQRDGPGRGQPLADADLRRGQTHTFGRVHRFEHVFDELVQIRCIEFSDVCAALFQHWMSVLDDRINHQKFFTCSR